MKFGEIARLEITGGGEGISALSQWCPLSGERKIPPFNPTKILGSSFRLGETATARADISFCRFKALKAEVQLLPPSEERYSPERRAAK
jgi:hypothetical protein